MCWCSASWRPPLGLVNSPVYRRTLLAAGMTLAAGKTRADERLDFNALYKSIGVRGAIFSDAVTRLAGSKVAIGGYMAPPLAAESRFFVLTSTPMTICPFCQSDADWPIDIVVIYMRHVVAMVDGGTRVEARGRLDIGSWTDPISGFVSLLRLLDADFRAI